MTVREFYKFHFKHKDIFIAKEVSQRRRFLTRNLQIYFNDELKRQDRYIKKYPHNKAYFEGLGFTPLEFCSTGYSISNSKFYHPTAIVGIKFKTVCDQNDTNFIQYKLKLIKIDGKWLIDDVIEPDGETLIDAFKKAKKIR